MILKKVRGVLEEYSIELMVGMYLLYSLDRKSVV